MPIRVNIHPNRISLTAHATTDRTEWSPEKGTWVQDEEFTARLYSIKQNSLDNLNIKGNPFIISKSGKKKLQDRIMSLYRLSTPRTIRLNGGKLLYNFRAAFITLTLPSKQMHTDKYIKAQCLNQLFVELRKYYKVENYVWKAELQANKNIHFHIIIDRFVSYYALRRRWNRILEKLGYIKKYSRKMLETPFIKYLENARRYNEKLSKVEARIRYEKGKAVKWSNPNSVDVKVIKEDKDVVIYMAKYMVKKIVDLDKEDLTKEEEELLERGAKFGRAWFCSRSLSRLKTSFSFNMSDVREILDKVKTVRSTKEFVGDYFKVYYFRYRDLGVNVKAFMRGWLMSNAEECGYIFPT